MKEFLPIGSVVILKSELARFMITGYVGANNVLKEVYDYIGCLYPSGVVDLTKNYFFNRDDIKEVVFEGYKDEKCSLMLKEIENNLTDEKRKEIIDNL